MESMLKTNGDGNMKLTTPRFTSKLISGNVDVALSMEEGSSRRRTFHQDFNRSRRLRQMSRMGYG